MFQSRIIHGQAGLFESRIPEFTKSEMDHKNKIYFKESFPTDSIKEYSIYFPHNNFHYVGKFVQQNSKKKTL